MKYSSHESTTNGPVKILIVDDHKVVREGLCFLLSQQGSFEVLGSAGSAEETLASVRHNPPDVAVLDISLGNTSGLDLLKTIHVEFPNVKVLVLSMHDEAIYAERCLHAGASGYIMKSEGHDKIVEGIQQVVAGKIWVSDAVRDRIWQHAVSHPKSTSVSPEERLSDRELQVFNFIGKGSTTQQIAVGLSVSPKTVQTYRNNIKEKLGIGTSTELTQRAVIWHNEQSQAK